MAPASGMNHINEVTIRDGKLITTSGGVRHAKQKYQGTTFVNTSVARRKSSAQPHGRRPSKSAHSTSMVIDLNGKRARRGITTDIGNTKSTRSDMLHSLEKCAQQQRINGLPEWSLYEFPDQFPNFSKRLFHIALSRSPVLAYPYFEDGILTNNPLIGPAVTMSLMRDETILLGVLATGAMYDAVRRGKKDSRELLFLSSELYSRIKDMLNPDKLGMQDINTAMYAISSLAMIAGYLHNHDHWHMHMRGLVRLMELSGGQKQVHPGIISGIRKADFTGALASSSAPYLTWMRYQEGMECPNAATFLMIDAEAHRILDPCGVDGEVTGYIAYAASLQKCIADCKAQKGKIKFDPLVFGEHHDMIVHGLLSTPGPLRESEARLSSTTPTHIDDTLEARAMSPGLGDEMTATQRCISALESALRILTILFLREPMVDLPCGEDVMLHLLEGHVKTLLGKKASRSYIDSPDNMVDRSLVAMKPPLIWISIAGDLLSKLHGSPWQGGTQTSHSLFKELLRSVLTSEEIDNPSCVPPEDLSICRILDLRYMRGGLWNDSEAMRRLLSIT
ncbi:hypothetical protein SCUP234_01061 [Seiridium cupressi]